jgi:hypothetical protein
MREWERDSVHGAQCGRMGNGEEETGNPAGREENKGKHETERDTGGGGEGIGKSGDTERPGGKGVRIM